MRYFKAYAKYRSRIIQGWAGFVPFFITPFNYLVDNTKKNHILNLFA